MLNSNENFLTDGTLEVHVIHVIMIRGGRTKISHESFAARLKDSKSIVRVVNKDNMCLARAILIGKTKADKIPIKESKSIKENKGKQTMLDKKYVKQQVLITQRDVVMKKLINFRTI